jgi:hypothetical protein
MDRKPLWAGVLLACALAWVATPAMAKKKGMYWGKAKHKCISYARGRVRAKLKGVPKGADKLQQCRNNPPAFSEHGAAGKPSCDKKLLGTYGEWIVENDSKCLPEWGKVRKKGCMSPNKQVYRSYLKDLKKGKAGEDSKGKAYRKAVCEETVGPRPLDRVPDRCVPKAFGVIWAEWYVEGEACEEPLDWGKFKDNGCVKDMKNANADLGGIDIGPKRSYTAKLKNVGGDWLDACRFAAAGNEATKDGRRLNFAHPTACYIADADKPLSYGIGAVFGGAAGLATMPAGGAGFAVGAVVSVASQAATEGLLAGVDTKTSVRGVFWVDDERCGTVPHYPPLHPGDGTVLLGTGEISKSVATGSVAAAPVARHPAVPPYSPTQPVPGKSPIQVIPQPARARAPANLAWTKWEAGDCTAKGREWNAELRNIPAGMDWKSACRSAVQLPYVVSNYPAALKLRLNSADPSVGYPDACLAAPGGAEGEQVVGQYIVADPSCR